MPSRRASSKSGRVSGPGISRSKNASISAWSSIHQRGKNVVERQLGKHHQLAAARMGLREEGEQALHHVRARLAPRDGTELGGADGEDAGHAWREPSTPRLALEAGSGGGEGSRSAARPDAR